MSNANFIELETCIQHCIDYCAGNQSLDFVEIYEPRLVHARARFDEGIEISDQKYLVWQSAQIDETRAWKQVASLFKSVQKELSRMGSTDFPNQNVMYWDTEILTDSVNALFTYIESFADREEIKGEVERLQRALNSAAAKRVVSEEKVGEYSRFSRMRSESLGTLNATLSDFRKSMRYNLGKEHADYLSIRWPMTLAPDERVL